MINKMREQINIENPVKIPNKSGGFETTYKKVFGPLWCELKPAGGREIFFAQKLQMNVTHLIKLRYIDGIKPNMRATFEGRIFKILLIQNKDERSRWLNLLCEEGSGN